MINMIYSKLIKYSVLIVAGALYCEGFLGAPKLMSTLQPPKTAEAVINKKSSFALYSAFRSSKNRFIPPLMEEKLAHGAVTADDLERMFGLTETDIEVINRITSIGYAGAIFELETSLVDMSKVFGYSYAVLAGELNQETPHPLKGTDTH
jgi:hypothetical protein